MFFKKEETLETIEAKCKKGFHDFQFSYSKAHSPGYFKFKRALKGHFSEMMDSIVVHSDPEIKFALFKHFHEQLKFINKNPFSANHSEYDNFLNTHFPYKQKIEMVIEEVVNKQNVQKQRKQVLI